MIQCCASLYSLHVRHRLNFGYSPKVSAPPITACSPKPTTTRRALFLSTASSVFVFPNDSCWPKPAISEFSELQDSGGVKALDLRPGTGEIPVDGDQVAIHYYGRLAAKQGWRFDSTYDHKDDETGEPLPFVFVLGSGKVIPGIEAAVRSMKAGGVRRVIIPPSQGYQNTSQEPIPPNHASSLIRSTPNKWFLIFQT